MEDNESHWADKFAKDMIAKRHQVDSGDATVSDLQIFYLQHDPASWINKSTSILTKQAARSVGPRTIPMRLPGLADMFSAIITTVGT